MSEYASYLFSHLLVAGIAVYLFNGCQYVKSFLEVYEAKDAKMKIFAEYTVGTFIARNEKVMVYVTCLYLLLFWGPMSFRYNREDR